MIYKVLHAKTVASALLLFVLLTQSVNADATSKKRFLATLTFKDGQTIVCELRGYEHVTFCMQEPLIDGGHRFQYFTKLYMIPNSTQYGIIKSDGSTANFEEIRSISFCESVNDNILSITVEFEYGVKQKAFVHVTNAFLCYDLNKDLSFKVTNSRLSKVTFKNSEASKE